MNPDPATLRTLADRAETEEPTLALRRLVVQAGPWTRYPGEGWAIPHGPMHRRMPDPLTSRDDAAGLMPEGWEVDHIGQENGLWMATLRHSDPNIGDDGYVSAIAPDEPRARTAAALRATAAQLEASP